MCEKQLSAWQLVPLWIHDITSLNPSTLPSYPVTSSGQFFLSHPERTTSYFRLPHWNCWYLSASVRFYCITSEYKVPMAHSSENLWLHLPISGSAWLLIPCLSFCSRGPGNTFFITMEEAKRSGPAGQGHFNVLFTSHSLKLHWPK